jgi:muconolactone delta-isomerase
MHSGVVMKYLVISKPRGNVPPAMAVNMLKATKTWVNARIKDRSLEHFYAFTIGGGVGVVNADSNDALMKTLRQNPAFPFVETEVHPLVDFNESIDVGIQMFEKMAG